MEKIQVSDGIYYVNIPEADLFLLCGCPADAVKHLIKRGLIVRKTQGNWTYETGPNAILLSDLSSQKGAFANLAEFAILHMLYRQGMLLPGHPNNTGCKPLLIGSATQIMAQSEYIFRGNYGLVSVEEIMNTGIKQDIAQLMFSIKLQFAYQKIKKTEELIDYCILGTEPVEIRNNVWVRRLRINVFEIKYGDTVVEIDLNLGPKESYLPAVNLDFHKVRREYFSVIHTGEGNGWDPNRQCMASILTFQGKIYLIDTGPNILHSLTALGISVNEIEGIFHTHIHDDHFAGLPTMVRADHRIKSYTTPLVRDTLVKKLSCLLSISEKRALNSFEVHDLHFNRWNNIDGLEVMPVYSPHPVETNVFFFRTLWKGGYKIYAHLADIASFEMIRKLLPQEGETVSAKFCNHILSHLTMPSHLKKIDIGGGFVHGRAEDFTEDKSSKILLSHINEPLTDSQKEIGSNASFGLQNVLISATQDYRMQAAYSYISGYFPHVSKYDIQMLLNCRIISSNVGSIVLKRGQKQRYVYFLLGGVVEVIDPENKRVYHLSAGSIIGEKGALTDEIAQRTYRAVSYASFLRIPKELFREFIKKNSDPDQAILIYNNRLFLRNSWLFGEMVSSMIHNRIAQNMKLVSFEVGEEISSMDMPGIFLIKSGKAELYLDEKPIEALEQDNLFGEESVFYSQASLMLVRVLEPITAFFISTEQIADIPIVEWKLLEVYERRLTILGTLLTK